MNIVVIGLSVTSSWGNGHATTYRALLREFARRGHDILFLERDVEWYASNRDLPNPDFCQVALYADCDELFAKYLQAIREANAVIVGSYVPEGVRVGQWATQNAQRCAFYDIDTPVTLAKLARGDNEYISPELIPRYNAYLSFSGGPTLQVLEQQYGSPRARALFCSVDPEAYFPEEVPAKHDLSYLGTYSDDRQPTLEKLLLEPARRWSEGKFCVAGPQYPEGVAWPTNVERIEHLPPARHRDFYNASRWTLNVTRADMIRAGWSPSVRLFEAGACGVPIVSDFWEGLGELFEIGSEIQVARSSEEALAIVRHTGEEQRRALGAAARHKVLGAHTAAHRARELEEVLRELG
jgi:spore maturation protein CgeB